MRTECVYHTDGGVQLQALVKAKAQRSDLGQWVNKADNHKIESVGVWRRIIPIANPCWQCSCVNPIEPLNKLMVE